MAQTVLHTNLWQHKHTKIILITNMIDSTYTQCLLDNLQHNVLLFPHVQEELNKLYKKFMNRNTCLVSEVCHHPHCPRSTQQTHFYLSGTLCHQNAHF